MTKKQRLVFFSLLALGVFMLQGCDAATVTPGIPDASFGPEASSTPTLLPAFVATPQAAQAAAQSTIQAGEARLAELEPQLTAAVATDQAIAAAQAHTATALIAEQERAAAATAEAISATESASAARTATASREAAEHATAEAFSISSTQTAAAQAAIDAIHAQETQAALSVVLAAATAEVQRIEEQQRSLLLRTWAWRIFWMALAILAVVAIIFLYRPLLRAVELWAITRRDKRGEDYLVERDRNGQIRRIHLPARSAGAVLHALPDGSTAVEGVSPHGPEWTDRTIAGEQFGKLIAGLAASRKPLSVPPGGRTPIEGLGAVRVLPPPEIAAPQAARQVVILEPGNPRVRPLLDEADRKLLEAGDEHEQLFD